VQLLLAFLAQDIASMPRRPIHKSKKRRQAVAVRNG